jgi:hypothetical protein
MGFLAIDWTMRGVTRPLAEQPRNTSAPSMASAKVRARVSEA